MSSNTLSGLINVALLGVDSRSYKILAAVFSENFSGKCKLTTPNEADIFVMDLDSKNRDEDLKLYEANYKGKPLIITSIQNQDSSEYVFVKKPINTDHLYFAIQALQSDKPVADVNNTLMELIEAKMANRKKSETASSIASKFGTGSTKQIKLTGANAKSYFNPKQFFLSVIQEAVDGARQKGSAAHIKLFGTNHIVVDYKNGLVQHDCKRGTQRQLYLLDIEEEDYKISIDYPSSPPKLQGTNVVTIPLETWLWAFALHTSKGRLPEGTSLEASYYLEHWPNFTRVDMTANSMRIASYWAQAPRKLGDIAAALSVEASEIFSFYTACTSLGLAGEAKRSSDSMVAAPTIVEESKRGLFASLLRKLRVEKKDDDDEQREAI